MATTTDWNALITPSSYFIGISTAANRAGDSYYRLDVSKINTFIMQVAKDFFSQATYTRYSSNSGGIWSAWDRSAGSTENPKRDLLINSKFDLWQRSTTQTGVADGSDDRWKNNNSGTTKTHSQVPWGSGDASNVVNGTYTSRTVVSSVAGAANYCFKAQFVEDVRLLSGKTVTFTFQMKADAAKNIAVEFNQNFGAGGSDRVAGISPKLVTLTTGFAVYSVTVTLPSVAGKTIGAGSSTAVNIWFDAGSDYNARTANLGQRSGTFDIGFAKLELGSVFTGWDNRTVAEELRLCQRYYEQLTGTVSVNQATYNWYKYKVTKRIAPAISLVSGSLQGSVADSPSNEGFRVITAATQAADFIMQADAEL